MITMQTIVDNAIEANAEAYKLSYSFAVFWENNKVDTDADKWACAMRNEYRAIEDTLKRLLPDHVDYVSDAMTALRVEVINANEHIKEVA